MTEKSYEYQRFNSKGMRVGQAALDLMQKRHEYTTVEELLAAMGSRYAEEIEKSIAHGIKHFSGDFYIFLLGKKVLGEFNVRNVERNWFIPRQTAPNIREMHHEYPHFTKTLYRASSKGDFNLVWTIPSVQDCATILKNAALYDEDLVKWCQKAA